MKNKSISSIVYIVVFVVFVGLIGFVSIERLIDFYVNDEIDYNEWTADLGNKFETDIVSTVYDKTAFVNLNGAIRIVLGQHEMNNIVKLNNGYLLTTMEYVDDETLQGYADNVSALNEYLDSKGIRLLYSVTPYTLSKYDNQLPVGVIDYGNDNIDRLIEKMNQKGVDTLDIREKMHNDGINQYDMMYKTDHHWTTKGGLYAYGLLEEYIVSRTGCKVDPRIGDESQYNLQTYKKWHLGSRGQRTGKYYAGIDDFTLYIPKFDTFLERNGDEKGSMPEVEYNMEALEKKDYSSRYTYDSVLDHALGNIKNYNSYNSIKILLLGDSFSKAVCPFLTTGFSEVRFIPNFEAARVDKELIEDYQPDVVILLYYPEFATIDQTHDFPDFE